MENKIVPFSIESSDAEVIQTGSVIISNGDFAEFKIADLRFKITFDNDAPNEDGSLKSGRIESRIDTDVSGKYLLLVLYNQTRAFYAGLNEPATIAQIEGRPLKFIFSVVDIHDSNCKLLFYTWMLNKNKNNSIINEPTNQ